MKTTARFRALAAGLTLAFAAASQAHAHHPMGGVAPDEFYTGLLSGLAHPIIDFGHFAFILGVGLLAAVAQRSPLLPLWFVGGSIAGCLFALNVLVLPVTQWLLIASVGAVGAALALGQHRLGGIGIALFALGGFLHGGAYADAVIGSEPTALNGYFLGLAIVQSLIAVGATWAAYILWCGDKLYMNARIAGGVICGIALALLLQGTSAAILPGMVGS